MRSSAASPCETFGASSLPETRAPSTKELGSSETPIPLIIKEYSLNHIRDPAII